MEGATPQSKDIWKDNQGRLKAKSTDPQNRDLIRWQPHLGGEWQVEEIWHPSARAGNPETDYIKTWNTSQSCIVYGNEELAGY